MRSVYIGSFSCPDGAEFRQLNRYRLRIIYTAAIMSKRSTEEVDDATTKKLDMEESIYRPSNRILQKWRSFLLMMRRVEC